MKKTLLIPLTRTLTFAKIRNTMTRGQSVALFVFLALAAAVVSSSSSALSKKPASESKGTSSTGMRELDLRPSRFATAGRSKLTVRSAIEDQPTITTDKTSYLPGEPIVFMGTNWAADEAITIAINADGISEGIQLHATADDAGSFTTTTIMPDSQSASAMKASAAKVDASAKATAQSSDAGLFTATATGASGATAQTQFKLAQDEDERESYDPDLPGFLAGKIDKEDYLRRREEHINKLRGIFPGRPFDPSWRGRAIRDMNQQEGRPNNSTSTFDSGSNKSSSTSGPVSDLLSGPNTPSSSTTWSSIGPSPLPNGQTFNTNNIPVSGRISAIAIHPTNSSIAYVGAAQGGVYRTLDGGATWKPIFDNAQTLAIGSIAIAPSQPSTIYVGTGEENFSCDTFFGVGVYRIDNADGASPTLSGPFNKDGTGTDQMTGRAIGKIVVHPTNRDIIFVATGSGIGGLNCSGIPGVDTTATSLRPRGLWRSSNATSANPTFDRMTVATDNGGNRAVTDIEFEPGNPNILFTTVLGFSTAGSGGVFYSTNPYAASPTFTRTLAASSMSTSERFEISLNKTGSTVYVFTATSQSSGTFKRGTYTAGTPSGLSWTGSIGTAGFCGGQCTYDMPIAVDPTDANIVYLGGPGDSGSAHILTKVTNATGTPTFTASQTGLHADEHAIEIDPNSPAGSGRVIWTGNDGGIWKSTNAASSWTSLNNAGFVATQFQSIAVHVSDANFTIGGTQDNGTECQGPCGTFSGNTWNQADYGDGGFALIDQSQTSLTTLNMYHTYYNQTNTLIGYAYVTGTANAKFTSNPIGNSWSFNGTGGAVSCTSGGGYSCTEAVEFYMPMAVGPGSPNPIYSGTDRLHRSPGPGSSNATVSQVFVSGIPISAVGISPQNDLVRIVGLENGRIFRTMTGQTTGWPEVTGSIPQASTNYISRAVIDPNNQNTAYITMSVYFGDSTSHIYKTTNLNAATPTWTGIDGGQIPDIPINAFAVDPSSSSFLYAGTDIGVYRSTDGGATWSPFSNGLPRVAVFDMAIQNANHILRIATHGRGMWEISIGATGNLQGTVTDASTSSPINGATVTAGASSTTTNGSGFYQFTGIPVGTYSVSASAPGYTSNSVAGVNVTDGGTTTQNIALTPAPTTGCFTDTSQADFQAGVASNVDLITTPGSVKLATGAGAIDQQNTNLGSSGNAITTTTWEAQSFVPGVTGQLTQLDVDLFCSGCSGTNPDITLDVRTTSGGAPTSTILATTTIPGFSSGTGTFYSAIFSTPASLTAGTTYAYVLRLTTNRTTGTYAALRSNNNQYANGAQLISTNSGSSWTAQSTDLGFKTYMSTGFTTSGDLTSSVKDSNPAVGATPNWTTVSWTGTTPASTTLKFQAAGSSSASGPFNFVGPDGTNATFFTTTGASLSQFNGNRYLKYKAYLSTSNSANTPTLNDVTVCFNITGGGPVPPVGTTLTVSPASGTYGSTADLLATLTSNESAVSGKTINFTLNGNSVGSAVTNASGVASLSSVSLSGINAGSYASGVGATFVGDTDYNASNGAASLTVNKASSTTTIDCTAGAPFTYTGSAITPCTAMATGAGGLNVSVTPLNYTNNVNAGSATASATYGGDGNHNGSTGNGGFTINKASSTTTIDCTAGAPFTYTGSAIVPCTATATGAGGLNVSVSPVNYTNNVNAGSATASATYGGDANHNGSTGNGGFTINKASSTTTIDCTAGAPFIYTGLAITPCMATATGAGGLNVSVTPVNYTNNVNAGAATASATYGGDANHDGSTGNGGFTINKAPSATTVTCGAGPFTYNGSAQTLCSASVIGAGGLSETLTVNYANNVNAGTATASASYGGDDNHTGSSDSKNFTIDKATATILVTGFTGPYDGNPHGVVSSSATGVNSEPLTGLVVDPTTYINVPGGLVHWSFTNANYGDQEGNATVSIGQAASMTVVTCPATPLTYTGSAITPCSISITGANLSLSPDPDYANNINAGTDTASASYTYPGDLNHTGSSDSKTFSIAKAPSTTVVTCGSGPFTYNGSPQTPCTANVTGAGGLSETLTVNYTDNTNAGTVTASATYAGDSNHDVSDDSKNFNISKATATLVVTGFNGPYDGNPHGVVSSSAIGANSEPLSGLVVDPTTYTNVPGGSVLWSFTNPNYGDQNGDATVTITKANQYITFGAIDDKTFGNADFGINATSSSGLTVNLAVASGPCTLDSTTSPANVHINGAGACTITASQPGNGNYNPATDKNRSFNIAKANQTITFTLLADKTFGDGDFTVSATGGGSGNPITFSASGKCTVSGSTVHITGAGSCQITAAQAGNDNYNPAPDVARSFNVAKASSTTTVTCPSSVTYTGSAQMPCSASVVGFGGLSQPLTVYYTNNVNAGTATASASYGGDADHNGSSDSKTFLIVAAGSITTVASSKNPSTSGDSVNFTATISPNTATGTVQFKIDGTNFGSPVTVVSGSATSGSTSSLTAGSHSISAVYSGDSNYTGSTGNLTQVVARPVKVTGGGSLSQVIHFGFNAKPVQDDTSAKGFKGHVEFHDLGLTGSADDLKFKSTSVNGEYALDNHHGTFTGAGTLNGVSGYLFTATIEDNAKKGAGNDKFRIQITNPGNGFNYDSNVRAVNADGTIIAGKIKIHYDKDDFNTSSLEGNGSFLAGALNFDVDVQTDGVGGYNAGAGVQFTDATNSYTLTSVSVDTMKVGNVVTVSGPALLNGVQGYKYQTDWDTGKLTLHLRVWDSAGKQVYDSKPSQLTSGSCAFIASN